VGALKRFFGIVQGGMYPELREQSAKEIVAMGFDGYALGGLSVGEDRATRQQVIQETVPFLPEEKPRYLMGVGKPEDILTESRPESTCSTVSCPPAMQGTARFSQD